MLKINEVIIVEGRYDKNTLSQIVDATIIETSGFGIIKDKQRLNLIRRIAEKQGVIILTDSDGAGFQIRNYLKGAIPEKFVKHAYIPDISGKEKRKKHMSGDGLIGVEGMNPEILLTALKNAGVRFDKQENAVINDKKVTKADLYSDGLSGGKNSVILREALLNSMGLPKKLGASAFLDVINILYTYDKYKLLVNEIKGL